MPARKTGTLRTNEDRLVEIAVLGQVAPAVTQGQWRLTPAGEPTMLPGVGGITYNCKVGDSALDWEVDHVEPGVSVKNEKEAENTALNMLACVGNVGRVVSGDAKGAEGIVTGKHGGVEHVLMDFPDEALEDLAIGDRVQVRACGLGLKLLDLPDVSVMNMAPRLLRAMAPERQGDVLRVRVAHRVPAAVMGSGVGRAHAFAGDCDIQMFDPETVRACGLADLRLGDLVAVEDWDQTYGRSYRPGAVSIGVVVHCCCTQAGHGPGLTALMSSATGKIEPVPDPRANIARYLRIGRLRGRRRR